MNRSEGMLTGIRVVEWGEGISAPYCGKLLAELGAEVVKVELLPRGDSARDRGPFLNDVPDPEASGLFLYLNAGKLGVALEFDQAEGRERFRALLAQADVLLHNQPLAMLASRGIDPGALTGEFPHLIVTTLSPYGASGPYASFHGYAVNTCALGGVSFSVGEPDRPPLALPLDIADYQAALGGATGTMAALIARLWDGRGQHVDVAGSDVFATIHSGGMATIFVYQGVTGHRAGHRRRDLYPYTVLPCKDGYFTLNAREGRQWKSFLEVMGNPQWAGRDKFRDRRAIAERYADEADELILPWLMQRSKAEFFALCREHRIPFAPIQDIPEVLTDEQLSGREFFAQVEHPSGHTLRVPGTPFRVGRGETKPLHRAPRLGEHNAAVLRSSPSSTSGRPTEQKTRRGAGPAVARSSTDRDTSHLPLAGYRVVDFGWVMAGPVLGHILADLGAEVIKIESRVRLDASRRGRPIVGENIEAGDRGEEPNLIPLFHNLNRGKLSATVNLTHPKAPEVLRRLIALADVVIENFPPGVLARRGLDYPALREIKPDVVMVSLSAVGQRGQLADLRGYAPAITSLAGLEGLIGYEHDRVLGMMGLNFSDPTASVTAAYAVLAALFDRERTGQGQYLDLSQLEANVCLLGEALLDFQLNGRVAGPRGNRHPVLAPHGNYRCAGTDRWISVAVGNEEEWAALVAVLGQPGLSNDSRFVNAAGRQHHAAELDEIITAWTQQYTPEEAMAALQARGVAAMPVMSIEEQFADPHLYERETYVTIDHPMIGEEVLYGVPWKLSRTPGRVTRPAPNLGEHTATVFCDLVGYSPEEYEQLVADQVLY